jgi:hypothetical protein
VILLLIFILLAVALGGGTWVNPWLYTLLVVVALLFLLGR